MPLSQFDAATKKWEEGGGTAPWQMCPDKLLTIPSECEAKNLQNVSAAGGRKEFHGNVLWAKVENLHDLNAVLIEF